MVIIYSTSSFFLFEETNKNINFNYQMCCYFLAHSVPTLPIFSCPISPIIMKLGLKLIILHVNSPNFQMLFSQFSRFFKIDIVNSSKGNYATGYIYYIQI